MFKIFILTKIFIFIISCPSVCLNNNVTIINCLRHVVDMLTVEIMQNVTSGKNDIKCV